MQQRHLCWPLYFFLGPIVPPPSLFILESPLLSQQNSVFAESKRPVAATNPYTNTRLSDAVYLPRLDALLPDTRLSENFI